MADMQALKDAATASGLIGGDAPADDDLVVEQDSTDTSVDAKDTDTSVSDKDADRVSASPGEETEEAESSEDSDQPEPGTDEVEAKFKDEYFGVNIREFADRFGTEAANELFETLEQTNRVVNRKLQEYAERRDNPESAAPETEAPAEVSDEDILRSFGLDPSNPYLEDIAPGLVAMGREVMAVRESLNQTASQSEAVEFERNFNAQLSTLENEHGSLGVDRDAVIQLAIDNEVFNPTALYWMVRGPAEKAARGHLQKSTSQIESQVAAIKKKVASPRGRTSAKNTTGAPVRPKNIFEAAELAKKQTGVSRFSDGGDY